MKAVLFVLSCFLCVSSAQIFAQEYKPVVKEDSSVWYVAHRQLAGKFIDTLFAKEKEGNWVDIYYRGVIYYGDLTYAGKVKESPLHDKIWYIPPEKKDSILVYNMTLEKGDTFMLHGYPGKVDTVYSKNNRKHIKFDVHTNWGDSIEFIEGVGPNVSFIYYWSGDGGILNPYVVCKFSKNTHLYAVNNADHFNGCKLNTTGIMDKSGKNCPIQLFPNPFHDYLKIKGAPDDEFVLSIYDTCSNLVLQVKCKNGENLNTSILQRGVYIARLTNIKNNKSYNFKIIKQ